MNKSIEEVALTAIIELKPDKVYTGNNVLNKFYKDISGKWNGKNYTITFVRTMTGFEYALVSHNTDDQKTFTNYIKSLNKDLTVQYVVVERKVYTA